MHYVKSKYFKHKNNKNLKFFVCIYKQILLIILQNEKNKNKCRYYNIMCMYKVAKI